MLGRCAVEEDDKAASAAGVSYNIARGFIVQRSSSSSSDDRSKAKQKHQHYGMHARCPVKRTGFFLFSLFCLYILFCSLSYCSFNMFACLFGCLPASAHLNYCVISTKYFYFYFVILLPLLLLLLPACLCLLLNLTLLAGWLAGTLHSCT